MDKLTDEQVKHIESVRQIWANARDGDAFSTEVPVAYLGTLIRAYDAAHPFAPTTSKDGLAELATEIINAVTDLADVNALDRALPDVMERLQSRTTDAELERLREALVRARQAIRCIMPGAINAPDLELATLSYFEDTLAKIDAALDTPGEGEG